MLNRDFLQVLLPILLEPLLFLPLLIELRHDVVQTLLEALLELVIVFIAGANNRLVMVCVLDFDLAGYLILDFIGVALYPLGRGWWTAWLNRHG